MDSPPVLFLDVPTLLQTSQPRPRLQWMRLGMGGFVLLMLLSLVVGRQSPGSEGVISLLTSVGMMGLLLGMGAVTYTGIREQRYEHARLEAIEELVQLRRWPEAAMMLQGALLRPARSPISRVQTLMYLTMVLTRYHRFDDAVMIYDYLLNEIRLDETGNHVIRLGRAMALLREDHLFDADRAIAELRRGDRDHASAGLALVEIYRDVKTGHPAEALETFEQRLPQMRRQLGHRIADAWALAARAYDLLGQQAQAKSAYENATLLAPHAELQRRYPELKPMAEKYMPALAPTEVA
jgi:tetratricopeptide (TPR) repeat protein